MDPVSAYLGTRINSYKDTEVRAVLAPVAALAEEIGAAVVGVMHLNKDQQKAAIYRTGGSIGFVGAARSVLAVAKDPDDADHRLLTPVKCNLAASPPTLGFRLPDGVVTWDPDPVDADVESLLDNRSSSSRS